MTIAQITDRTEHDAAVAKSKSKPTVIYVSNNVTPTCRAFTPQYEELAAETEQSGIAFYQMEFTNSTSNLFKFAPNQLPVIVLMCGGTWCKTVMGATMRSLQDGLDELQERELAN